MKDRIRENISKILKKLIIQNENWKTLDLDKIYFEVEKTRDIKFGDLTSNVAMVLAGNLKMNPREIAQIIFEELNIRLDDDLERVELVLPGYLNFYFSKKYIAQNIKRILELGEKWGETEKLKGKKYIFEHSSPNLFKPFHIGHLVNNSIGESLARIIKKSGAEVKTLSFPSDISPGIAKTVWAIKEKGWKEDLDIEKIGEAYVFGSASYKESDEAKLEIDKINEALYNSEGGEIMDIYKEGQKLSLDYFKQITKKLGSVFDELIFESEAEKVGKEIVRKNIGSIFRESQGAIIFPGSEYGLFDNVFINSQGFGTYLTKDIGLLKIKFDKYIFDKSITITDVEQRDHFRLVKKAGELIDENWSLKSEFIQHGRLGFAGGKISSRYGNVPLAEDLISEVEKKILEKIKEQDFPQEEKKQIAKKVSIAALKYSILRSGAGKNIIFDFEKATAFEGDTGPYLQYALVRSNSILKNALKEGFEIDFKLEGREAATPIVERMVLDFPEAIEKSLDENSPHHLANFIFKLASEFSSFYGKTKVVDKKNPDFKNNLALVGSVQITLKNGLELLGIETLDRM